MIKRVCDCLITFACLRRFSFLFVSCHRLITSRLIETEIRFVINNASDLWGIRFIEDLLHGNFCHESLARREVCEGLVALREKVFKLSEKVSRSKVKLFHVGKAKMINDNQLLTHCRENLLRLHPLQKKAFSSPFAVKIVINIEETEKGNSITSSCAAFKLCSSFRRQRRAWRRFVLGKMDWILNKT